MNLASGEDWQQRCEGSEVAFAVTASHLRLFDYACCIKQEFCQLVNLWFSKCLAMAGANGNCQEGIGAVYVTDRI